MDSKVTICAEIQLVTMNDCLTSSICQLPSNGTNLQFQLCIFLGSVIIISPIEEYKTEFHLQHLEFADRF